MIPVSKEEATPFVVSDCSSNRVEISMSDRKSKQTNNSMQNLRESLISLFHIFI